MAQKKKKTHNKQWRKIWSALYERRYAAAAAAKSLQSSPTLCDPIDCSPPGSPVPGILQARTLEWGAISFSIAWKWKVKVKSLSRVRLFVTPWTAAYQAPPSMGFSRQEYWSGVPLPSPERRYANGQNADINIYWGRGKLKPQWHDLLFRMLAVIKTESITCWQDMK